MKRCAVPGCDQALSLGGRFCYYHSKMAEGLLQPDRWVTEGGLVDGGKLRRALGIQFSETPRKIWTTHAGEQLTDEQLELEDLLRVLQA